MSLNFSSRPEINIPNLKQFDVSESDIHPFNDIKQMRR